MSLVEDKIHTERESVNVEDILANFFLKKIDMKDSRSESDSKYKKKSKHKKHKSKKHKHKSGRRSDSSERRNSNSLSIGRTSSSEEKDIKRLKKLKKLDVNDQSKFNSFLPVPPSTQSALSSNENFQQNDCASSQIDIPYGPSLELLLTGTETLVEHEKQSISSHDQSEELSSHPKSLISACGDDDPKPSNELVSTSKESESKSIENTRLECKEENVLNDVELYSNKLLDTSKQIEETTEFEGPQIDPVVKQKSNDKKEKKFREKSRSRSRSKSKPRKRSRSRSCTVQSRSRKRSDSRSRKRSGSRSRKRSDSRSRKRSGSRPRKRSGSRSRKCSGSRSRKRSDSRSRKRSGSRPRKRSGSRSRKRSGSRSRKRSDSRSRNRSVSRSRKRSGSRSKNQSGSKSKKRSDSRSRKRSVSSSRKHSDSRSRKRSKSRSRSRSRKERSLSRDHSKAQHSSQPTTRRSRSRNRSKKSRSRSRSSRRRKRSHSRSYSKDNARSKRRSRSNSRRYRSRSRSKDRGSQHSRTNRKRKSSSERESGTKRSRSKSKDKNSTSKSCKIDQAKIREIAEKNVLNMIQQGTLPEGISLEHFKKKELVSIKAGGKSVQELTDFCAKLSKRENEVDDTHDTNDVGNLEGESAFIHHPFKLKEQSTIKLNIRNAVQIPIKTHAEKFAETAKLSSQFPVSSGDQHKQKELEWIPVVPEEKKSDLKPNEAKSVIPLVSSTSTLKPVSPKAVESTTSTTAPLPISSDIPSIPLPSTPMQPLPPPPLPPPLPAPLAPPFQFMTPSIAVQAPEVKVPFTNSTALQSVSYPSLPLSNSLPVPTCSSNQIVSSETGTSYFSNQTPPTSKSSSQFFSELFAKKMQAEQKLQADPNNVEALKSIQETEAALQGWVNACKVPGMFYGNQLVKPLPRDQLGGVKDYRVKKTLSFTISALLIM